MTEQRATFGAGCFWGVELAFGQVAGVKSTSVGYMGGDQDQPSYEDVCTGSTGHAEVVQVVYDPQMVTFEKLLEVFWVCHDPTQRDRQGPDVGTQYRSAIFFHDESQQEAAQSSMDALEASGRFGAPIVTDIAAAHTFFPAEEYHQQYLSKRGLASCSLPPSVKEHPNG